MFSATRSCTGTSVQPSLSTGFVVGSPPAMKSKWKKSFLALYSTTGAGESPSAAVGMW
uniref:Uncharacterized protein n=1 Tax=Setaria italica TaxID=4555 RepID=K4AN46_SETIT